MAVSRLTQREMVVTLMTGRGHTSREIADRLSLDPKTVETYRRRAADKMHLTAAQYRKIAYHAAAVKDYGGKHGDKPPSSSN
jgi:DNA-binding CsgD family transcriptional regulator